MLCEVVLAEGRRRGIDLRKWFAPDQEGTVIPRADFERRLMGLGLGRAAGMVEAKAKDVELGLTREALDEVQEAAAAGEDDAIDVAVLL